MDKEKVAGNIIKAILFQYHDLVTFSKENNIAATIMYDIKNLKRLPSIETLYKICSILKVDANVILGLSEDDFIKQMQAENEQLKRDLLQLREENYKLLKKISGI